MKQILVLLLICVSLATQAQRIELGYHIGDLQIAGDLKSKSNLGTGLHLRTDLTDYFALRADVIIGNTTNYNNKLLFNNKYQSIALQTILFTNINKVNIYGFTGINSLLSHNWTYSNNIGVDVGFGIGYQFNERISLNIEPKLTYTNNDNLDGYQGSPNKYNDVVYYLPLRLCITLQEKSNNDIALQKCLDWCKEEPYITEIRDTTVLYDTIYNYTKTTINHYITNTIVKDSVVFVDSSMFKIFPLIWFETDKYEVSDNYYDEIAEIAAYMKKYPHRMLYINGHASKTGESKYNNTLSSNRALAVKEILVIKYKIEANRLFVQSYGDRVPLSINKDFMNQRVEFSIAN